MQMTYEQAQRGGLLHAFSARRSGYMMRSEKRPDAYGGGGRQPGRRPPRRKRAGGFYIFLTLLVSVILWPIGMVMLWRRKVRMQVGTKLLVSLLTLCVSVFLIVFALTVPVQNEQFTAFQDRANDWLDQAGTDISVAGEAAYKKSAETWDVMAEFAGASSNYAAGYLADGLDKGVEWAGEAREAVTNLLGVKPAEPEATEAPADTEAPAADETPAADSATKAPAKTKAATEAPAETEAAPAKTEAAVIELPEATPDAGAAQALTDGTLHTDGSFTPDPEKPDEKDTAVNAPAETEKAPAETEKAPAETEKAPAETEAAAAQTEAPAETAEATPEEPLEPAYVVKPATAATVYYNIGGRAYHISPDAHPREMDSAPAHTLAEAIAAEKDPCQSCQMPGAEVLDIAHIAWVDEANRIHTTDECPSFQGKWKLMSLEDAIAAGCEPCADCRADVYRDAIVPAPTPEPTPEPTPKPTPEPTPEPTPQVISPAKPLKSVGDMTVYYYDASKAYHVGPNCKGMSNAPSHTLSEGLAAGKRACGNCNPPAAELVGLPVLWLDENNQCHTTDSCPAFAGSPRFIQRDEALEQGLAGCPGCGADEYLIPGTLLADD